MPCPICGCIEKYDFSHVTFYAIKRHVEGISTITLMCNAKSESEKEQIALVSLLDLDDEIIKELNLCCSYECQCRTMDYRHRLKSMIKHELIKQK